MQELRLFFAMALLYMFRVTIPPIIRSTYAVYGLSGRQVYLCCNFVNILVVLSLTRILTKLQYKYTCLPERPYTALYSWWWVELSPEACRVKPLRRINAIVASCWIYFTIMHFIWLLWLVGRVIPHRIGHVLSSSIALIPDILRLFVVFISLSNRILL